MFTITAYGTSPKHGVSETARPTKLVEHALACALIALATGLSVVGLLGPLVTGVVDYRVTETLRNQTIGLDAVSLFVVAPLALAAAALVWQRRVAGPALALPIGAYTSYMFAQYVLGPDYTRLPGNNEKLFPLCLGLFAAGWIVSLTAWNCIPPTGQLGTSNRDRLVGRMLLPILALLAFVRYLPALADAFSAKPSADGYLAGPTFFWTIALLDLGVFLPATIVTCFGLIRGSSWAHKALYLVAGWFGLVGIAVAAMAIAMQANNDPLASSANTAFMIVLGTAFALLTAYVYRPLFRNASK